MTFHDLQLRLIEELRQRVRSGAATEHRYNFDGYGETSSGGDYTGTGTGNPWPVLSGERGEYDVADGNSSGAQSMLQTMAGAANTGYQISEQVWGGSTGTGGFTFGQADNSSTPLM